MYHSITFDNKNTWDDWCIIPENDVIIAPPAQKTNYIDIPGGNGSLDMSESLTGYPLYENRTGSITFIVVNSSASLIPNCNPIKWRNLVTNIMSYLHGKRRRMILEDDPTYYYEGRFNVESVESGEDFSRLTIGYNLDPYKLTVESTVGEWIWDTFNFQTGIITTRMFSRIDVTTDWKSITIHDKVVGDAPVVPSITAASTNGEGIIFRFVNPTLHIDETKQIPNGTFEFPDFVIYGDPVSFYYRVTSGTGTLRIEYRQGAL